jgi:hypothetical protein
LDEFGNPSDVDGEDRSSTNGENNENSNPAVKNRLGTAAVVSMAAGGFVVVMLALLLRRRPKRENNTDCSSANMIEIGNTGNPILGMTRNGKNDDYSASGIIPEPIPTRLIHNDLVDIDLSDDV